jgi:16S rRNA processing protein RimM
LTVSNPKSNSELVPIAKVGRPHGLRGAFFVSGREDLIPIAYGEVFIGHSPTEARVAKILGSQWQSQRPVLKCSLASDRTQAELLTNQTIFVPESRLRQVAGQGAMLWLDLKGAEVRDPEDHLLGIVTQVYNTGASDIIEIQGVRESGVAGAPRRVLDIPLVEDYVDLSQTVKIGLPAILRLKVPASIFEDLWQEMT